MFTHAHTFLQEKMEKILGAQIGVCTHACMHVLVLHTVSEQGKLN